MKKFRSKNYTIPEGHYTGPQQATTASLKSAALGAGVTGAAINGLRAYLSTDDPDYNGMSTVQRTAVGASKGFLYGALAGILIKGATEYMNKPLSDIEFQKLDKSIRSEFGMYKVPLIGTNIGTSNEKIRDMKDKVVYNSKNITDFKINFGIRRNQIVMYTFGITDSELDELSNALDEIVMTQPNMKYNASLINKSQNSYAVAITFTTYDVAGKYIVQAANIVSGRVNVIDRDYAISNRIDEFNVDKIVEDPDLKAGIDSPKININNNIYNTTNNDGVIDDDSVKTFSLTGDDKYSAMEFLRSDGGDTVLDIVKSIRARKLGSTASNHLGRLIRHAVNRAIEKGKVKAGLPAERRELNTSFLIDTLNKLRYTKGFNYTVDKDNSECNISMVGGIFVVSIDKGDKSELVDKEFYGKAKDRVRRSEISDIISYTYAIVSRSDFEFLLKKLFSTKLKFNIIS